jgi:hypothetical protein
MKRFLLALSLLVFIGCATKEVKPDTDPKDVEPTMSEDAGVSADAWVAEDSSPED